MGLLATGSVAVLLTVSLAIGARMVSEYRRSILRDFVVHEHYPGKCEVVEGITNGSEDVALVPGTSFALITNGLRLTREPNKPGGHMYIFDFKNPASGARPLQFVNFDKQAPFFSPHGLKIWPNLPTASKAASTETSTSYYVYVVSHVQNGKIDHVEKFRFDTADPTKLTFVKSITDEKFHGVVNSIAVVAEDTFYFTNFLPHFYNPVYGKLPQLEVLLGVPTGSVGFYDGNAGRIVARGHLAPNGIAVSNDLRKVYVADTHNGYVYTYARSGFNEKLSPQQKTATASNEANSLTLLAKNYTAYGILDNIVVDEHGNLLIGTSPFGHAMWNFVFGKFVNRRLESAVLKLQVDSKTNVPISTRELFMDDAKLMSGGSVAVTYGNGRKMLVGSVLDNLVYCECSVGC